MWISILLTALFIFIFPFFVTFLIEWLGDVIHDGEDFSNIYGLILFLTFVITIITIFVGASSAPERYVKIGESNIKSLKLEHIDSSSTDKFIIGAFLKDKEHEHLIYRKQMGDGFYKREEEYAGDLKIKVHSDSSFKPHMVFYDRIISKDSFWSYFSPGLSSTLEHASIKIIHLPDDYIVYPLYKCQPPENLKFN